MQEVLRSWLAPELAPELAAELAPELAPEEHSGNDMARWCAAAGLVKTL
jgi:uncharacterized protein (DUF2235 family)